MLSVSKGHFNCELRRLTDPGLARCPHGPVQGKLALKGKLGPCYLGFAELLNTRGGPRPPETSPGLKQLHHLCIHIDIEI